MSIVQSPMPAETLTPKQQALRLFPKLVLTSAGLGAATRMLLRGGNQANRRLTSIPHSKPLLDMPDADLMSEAELARRKEERKLLEQQLKSIREVPMSLKEGGLFQFMGDTIGETTKRMSNTVTSRIPESWRPAPKWYEKYGDPVGAFMGDYANSAKDVPLMWTAAIPAMTLAGIGAYKATDKLLDAKKKFLRNRKINKARKKFEDALLLEQRQSKLGSALDDWCEAVENKYGTIKEASLLEAYLSLLGGGVVTSALLGGYAGFNSSSNREKMRALEKARAVQLARRRDDETKVRLVSPTLTYHRPAYDKKKDETGLDDEEKGSTQSEINAGEEKFAGIGSAIRGVAKFPFRAGGSTLRFMARHPVIGAAGALGGAEIAGAIMENPYIRPTSIPGAIMAPIRYLTTPEPNWNPQYEQFKSLYREDPPEGGRTVKNFFDMIVGKGNRKAWFPTYGYKPIPENQRPIHRIKPVKTMNPDAVLYANPSVNMQRMTNQDLLNYDRNQKIPVR